MKALIPLADGAEDMETVILADVFRRAGWTVVLAGVAGSHAVTCSRKVVVTPDDAWSRIRPEEFDLIVLPGGMGGATTLRAHPGVQETLRKFHAAGKWVGAICAGPLALARAGLLDGHAYTCYPGLQKEIPSGKWKDARVVVDGKLVTSQGPGTCIEFALKLVDLIEGTPASQAVAEGMLVAPSARG